jgi:putative acetyltransferase
LKVITIRPEKPEDCEAIAAVNRAAFEGEFEARLVERLRESEAFIPELSLVAVVDGQILGHILLSTVHVAEGGKRIPVISLAPMAVLPKHQNKGIGSQLVRGALKRCAEMGHSVVVLVGHANYYPRFGFTAACVHGLKLPFKAPDEAFMVCELKADALREITGEIVYPPEFSEEP